ncbi:hypothetical protein EVAR_101006_1 [Eumeta japonica]|uniref:Uncharacterized protein n=1 Tax=Eumeta variegata TaxID=151549 RepID=A0A4C1SN22_EUMVA|nr:hypothetical protein EVAR_101006_1 [Eumeta japonica]
MYSASNKKQAADRNHTNIRPAMPKDGSGSEFYRLSNNRCLKCNQQGILLEIAKTIANHSYTPESRNYKNMRSTDGNGNPGHSIGKPDQ